MNENKEKERIESLEETNLKWQGILLLIILLFFFYLVASIIVSIAFDTSTIFNQAKFDSNLMVNIKPIIIFLIVD